MNTKKKLAILASSVVLLSSPLLAFAQISTPATPTANTTLDVTGVINAILNLVWPLFIGFAVVMFLIAGFMFVVAQGDPKKVGDARMFVLWGVVGVAMGVLAFSLPFIIQNTFNI